MDNGWARLGEMIKAEQARLYETHQDFADAAGVGLRTVDKLMAGQRAEYRAGTMAGVEAALGWEHGSFARVLEGGQPRRSEDVGWARLRHAWPHLTQRERRVILAVLDALREAI